MLVLGVQEKYIFQRIFNILPPLSRRHWAHVGRSENGDPIGVPVHSDVLGE